MRRQRSGLGGWISATCHACGKCWERSPEYIQCIECGHVYPTRWHLLAAYRRNLWRARVFRKATVFSEPLELSWWSLLVGGGWRPGRIWSCQCCTHDF